jgi:hypothetical protein
MRNIPFYLLAILFGSTAGILAVKLGDLLVTALFVLLCTMILGAARPERLWRWIVIVAIFIPILRVAAYLTWGQKPYLAQIWEPGFAFVIAAVGAYCGMFARKAVENLFAKSGNARG